MAKIQVAYTTADLNVYVLIRNEDGLVYNVVDDAFEAYDDENLPDYAIPLVEQGDSSGFYSVDFPTAITEPGTYTVTAHNRAGATPAVPPDVLIASGTVVWDGASEVDISLDGLVSLDYVKSVNGITGTTYDTVLSHMIAAASAAVMNMIGKTILPTTFTEYVRPDHNGRLMLKHVPILSVTSIVDSPEIGGGTTIDSDDYFVDTGTGEIRPTPYEFLHGRRRRYEYWPYAYGRYIVTYVAGYNPIPADLKYQTALMIGRWFEDHSNGGGEIVKEVLGDYAVTYSEGSAGEAWAASQKSVLDRYKDWCIQ